MLPLDQLTDIIAQGEQIDVKFMSDRHNVVFHGLINHEVTEIEGNP